MIVVRRLFAVLALPVLIAAFLIMLVTARINATFLEPGFYQEQVRALRLFETLHDEIVPTAIGDALDERAEWVPESLESVELPTDEASRRVIAELVREAAPPEVLQAMADEALDAVVPYLAGRTEGFEFRVRLGERLRALAGHAPGQPSALRRAWHQLAIADRTVDGLVETLLAEEALTAVEARDLAAAPGGGEPQMRWILSDRARLAAWLDTQLFAAIDELLPFLLGERDGFRLVVRFDDLPEMADLFAGALDRDPADLVRDGFAFDDGDFRAQLAGSGPDAGADIERVLAVFRDEGFAVTEADLAAGPFARADGAAEDAAGPGIEQLRSATPIVANARHGALAAILGLALLIGILGGRTWRSRLAWASGAVLVAGTVSAAAFGPVYDATAGELIEDGIAQLRAEQPPDGRLAPITDRLLDRGEGIADESAAQMSRSARLWAAASALALLAVIASSAWARSRRRELEGGPDQGQQPARAGVPQGRARSLTD